jgi:ABC-type Fe3+-hydroxamate transport system substrate-binding protein
MALNMVEDMMGRTVHLPEKVNRIVSLVPSQTELLYDLGIMPVGQTLFCVHPKEHFKNAVKIGGTKKLNIEKIKGLKPDLIVGNKEENDKDQIEELSAFFPVWMSDIYTLEDALVMIRELGSMLQVNEAAMDMVTRIKSGFDALAKQAANHQTVAYLIWKNPYMAAGRQTFIQSMLDMLGCQNVLNDSASRYPELTESQLKNLDPKVVLLSSEPFPFKEKHIKELQKLLPSSKIILVNGEYFSWYGSRLLLAPSYFDSLISRLKR